MGSALQGFLYPIASKDFHKSHSLAVQLCPASVGFTLSVPSYCLLKCLLWTGSSYVYAIYLHNIYTFIYVYDVYVFYVYAMLAVYA